MRLHRAVGIRSVIFLLLLGQDLDNKNNIRMSVAGIWPATDIRMLFFWSKKSQTAWEFSHNLMFSHLREMRFI